MAKFFDETPDWPQVREVGVGEPVTGGGAGTVNQSLAALVKRDAELMRRLSECASSDDVEEMIGEIDLSPYAPKASPIFTGKPQAPTAPQNTNDAQIATTAFVQNLIAAIKPFLCPPGTVINFAGASAPGGFLLCDGRAVSRTDYAALFAAVGTKYGAGDGSTTFNLPLLTDNRFIEGAASAGTKKNAGLPNITGVTSWAHAEYGAQGSGASGAFTYETMHGTTDKGIGHDTCVRNVLSASRSSSIYGNSNTVQPKSLTLLPCIKY